MIRHPNEQAPTTGSIPPCCCPLCVLDWLEGDQRVHWEAMSLQYAICRSARAVRPACGLLKRGQESTVMSAPCGNTPAMAECLQLDDVGSDEDEGAYDGCLSTSSAT